jgi:hypothetical protein
MGRQMTVQASSPTRSTRSFGRAQAKVVPLKDPCEGLRAALLGLCVGPSVEEQHEDEGTARGSFGDTFEHSNSLDT